jgi:prepilin-type N-terminal cleavage/methylation domain-containing protein
MKLGFAGRQRCQEGGVCGTQSPRALPAKSQKGGTLIEVVIAVVILAIMGGGIISSINYGLFMMRLARENARATQIILEKLETIRLYSWDQVTTSGYVPATFTDVYDPQAPTNQQGVTYNGTMTVSNVNFSSTYTNGMRQFTVTLQWVTAGRINHNRTMSTYVAQHGLQNYVY